LERQRVLHVAQDQQRPRARLHAVETRARRGVSRTQRFQPPLRFFLEVVAGRRRGELSRHTNLLSVCACCPLASGRKKVSVVSIGRGWEQAPLPRTGGAPMRAVRSIRRCEAVVARPFRAAWSIPAALKGLPYICLTATTTTVSAAVSRA